VSEPLIVVVANVAEFVATRSPDVTVGDTIGPFTERFVNVAFVPVMLVIARFVPVAFVKNRFEIYPVIAESTDENRFVEVAEVIFKLFK
jgi:hypothetical protein